MKKIACSVLVVVFAALLLSPNGRSQERMKWGIIYATNASHLSSTNFTSGVSGTNSDGSFRGTNIFCSVVTVRGATGPRTVNTSTIYIGNSTTSTNNPYPVVSNGEAVFTAPAGKSFNLRDLYFDVITDNDGITIIYQ